MNDYEEEYDDFEVVVNYLDLVNDFIKQNLSEEMNDFLIQNSVEQLENEQEEANR